MGFYRAITNVQTLAGIAGPNTIVQLTEAEAVKLASIGAIDPVAVAGENVLGQDDRLTALSAYIPTLMLGDLSDSGSFTPTGAERIRAALGFVPTDDELRAAGEAFMHSRTASVNALGPLLRPAAPGGLNSADPAVRIHGEASAASPTTEGEVRAASTGLTVDERQATLLTAIAGLGQTDFTTNGLIRAEARRRLSAQLGYDIADEELRAAIEAAKAEATRT